MRGQPDGDPSPVDIPPDPRRPPPAPRAAAGHAEHPGQPLSPAAGLISGKVYNQAGDEVGTAADVVARWDGGSLPARHRSVVKVGRRLAFVAIDQVATMQAGGVRLRSARLDLRDFPRRQARWCSAATSSTTSSSTSTACGWCAPPTCTWRGSPPVSPGASLPAAGGRRRQLPDPAAPPRPDAVARPRHARPGDRLGGHPALRRRGRRACGCARPHEALRRLRPGELADLLEDLGRAERQELLAALEPETAADALEEMDPEELGAAAAGDAARAGGRTRWRRWSPTRRSTPCATWTTRSGTSCSEHMDDEPAAARLRELLEYRGGVGRRLHDHEPGDVRPPTSGWPRSGDRLRSEADHPADIDAGPHRRRRRDAASTTSACSTWPSPTPTDARIDARRDATRAGHGVDHDAPLETWPSGWSSAGAPRWSWSTTTTGPSAGSSPTTSSTRSCPNAAGSTFPRILAMTTGRRRGRAERGLGRSGSAPAARRRRRLLTYLAVLGPGHHRRQRRQRRRRHRHLRLGRRPVRLPHPVLHGAGHRRRWSSCRRCRPGSARSPAKGLVSLIREQFPLRARHLRRRLPGRGQRRAWSSRSSPASARRFELFGV